MALRHDLSGAGDDVLILANPAGFPYEFWDPHMETLGARARVLRYDNPPAAQRDADTVEALAASLLELLDELAIERYSFCGLQLGGSVGLVVALEQPDRIQRLVVSGAAALYGPSLTAAGENVREHGITDAVLEHARWRFFTPEFADADRYLDIMRELDPANYASDCLALGAFDVVDRVGQIRTPTLVIGGAQDPPPALDGLAALADAIPGADGCLLIAEAANLMPAEQPDAFDRAVLGHLFG